MKVSDVTPCWALFTPELVKEVRGMPYGVEPVGCCTSTFSVEEVAERPDAIGKSIPKFVPGSTS